MPTDPTPTPTPREVLAKGMNEWADWAGRAVSLPTLFPDAPIVVTLERDYRAALAATVDAPLPPRTACPECGEECPGWVVQADFYTGDETQRRCRACDEYEQICAAYTTLAAQLAAARAERDALREANTGWQRFADHAPGCYGDDQCHCGLTIFRARHATPARPTDTGRDG